MSRNGKARRGMSMTTRAIICGCTFLLALITVIVCVSTGLFVFKPGSVQANDKDAATALAAVSQPPKNENGEPLSEEHTVLISVGNGGSAHPSGSVTVTDGSSLDIYFEADKGYELRSITLDGKDMGAWRGYTLSNITEDHTIIVTFKSTSPEVKPQTTEEPTPQETQEPEPQQTQELVEPPVDSGEGETADSGEKKTEHSSTFDIHLNEFGNRMDEFFSIFGN